MRLQTEKSRPGNRSIFPRSLDSLMTKKIEIDGAAET
jgi:hypothetical protein